MCFQCIFSRVITPVFSPCRQNAHRVSRRFRPPRSRVRSRSYVINAKGNWLSRGLPIADGPRDLVAFTSMRHRRTFNDPVTSMPFQIIKRVYPQHPPSCTRCRTIEMIAICASRPRKEDLARSEGPNGGGRRGGGGGGRVRLVCVPKGEWT